MISQRLSATATPGVMLSYHFTMHDDRSGFEELGHMQLDDDDDALVFGELVVRDMIYRVSNRYKGWTINVTENQRAVCSIPCCNDRNRKIIRLPPTD